MKWFEKSFEAWLNVVGGDKAKEMFWSMAAGKVHESPFGKEMTALRQQLDAFGTLGLGADEVGRRPEFGDQFPETEGTG